MIFSGDNDDNILSNFLDQSSKAYIAAVTSRLESKMADDDCGAFALWTWLAKALVLRAHPSYTTYINKVRVIIQTSSTLIFTKLLLNFSFSTKFLLTPKADLLTT